MPAFLLASVASVVLFPLLFWLLLRRIPMDDDNKKWLFAFMCAFCGTVILIPAPAIFMMPMPHLLALIAVVMGSTGPDAPDFIEVYAEYWTFNAPSFFLTLLIFRGIAKFAFDRKLLQKDPEKPI
jgi:hypothetical protein